MMCGSWLSINQALKDDVVSIDFGVILNGWHGDHAYTFLLGKP
jgi:methionyl aminopeptidase